MRQRNRPKALVIGLAIAATALLAACNPITFTATTGNIPGHSVPAAHTYFYRYDGPSPAWIQVRVVSSVSERVNVSGWTDDPAAFCIGDGAYGSDLWVHCTQFGQPGGAVGSPLRATWTEGVSRGWKNIFAVNPGSEVQFTFETNGPLGERFPIEVRAVDGNGARLGELTYVPTGLG